MNNVDYNSNLDQLINQFTNVSEELKKQLETFTLSQLQQLKHTKGTDLSKIHPIQIPGLIKYCKEKAALNNTESKVLVVSHEPWRQQIAWCKVRSLFVEVDFRNKKPICMMRFSNENQAIDFAFKVIRYCTLLKNDTPKLIPPFAAIAHNLERSILWLGAGQKQVNQGTDYFINQEGGYFVALYWPGTKNDLLPDPDVLDDFIEKYLNAPEQAQLLAEEKGTLWTWFNRNDTDDPTNSALEFSYVNESQIRVINHQHARRKPGSKRGSWQYLPVQGKRWKYDQIDLPPKSED